MKRLLTEQLRLLTRASPEVPGNPHVSTLIRWAHHGIRGVKLETVMVGGRRFTSVEAVHRFLARLNQTGTPETAASSPASERETARIEAQLDAEGIR
jgi:hypothetical protein